MRDLNIAETLIEFERHVEGLIHGVSEIRVNEIPMHLEWYTIECLSASVGCCANLPARLSIITIISGTSLLGGLRAIFCLHVFWYYKLCGHMCLKHNFSKTKLYIYNYLSMFPIFSMYYPMYDVDRNVYVCHKCLSKT